MPKTTRPANRAKPRKKRAVTARQQAVLDTIKNYLRRHGVPPTRIEIARELGLREASSVSDHLKRLQRAGRIEVIENKNRSIRLVDDHLPVVRPIAEVAAGTPILCETNIVERLPAALAERFQPAPTTC